ncbi:MAG: hypothetical protein WCJ62_12130 [Flavobacterium sp.]
MSWFGTEAGQSAIGSGINFGLGAIGTAISSNQNQKLLEGQANLSAQQGRDALAVEQEKTKQALLMLEANKPKEAGNNTLYYALGIGGVLVLVVVIFAVTRSK